MEMTIEKEQIKKYIGDYDENHMDTFSPYRPTVLARDKD